MTVTLDFIDFFRNKNKATTEHELAQNWITKEHSTIISTLQLSHHFQQLQIIPDKQSIALFYLELNINNY